MLNEVIYVSHPMTTDSDGRRLTDQDVEKNIEDAMDIGYVLLDAGLCPFMPELNHYFDLYIRQKYPAQRSADEFWLPWDLNILKNCDSFLYIAPSYGCDIELETAKKSGLHIYYGISDIINHIEQIIYAGFPLSKDIEYAYVRASDILRKYFNTRYDVLRLCDVDLG